MGMSSALNWYQKKIGAYDKQLWEKSVEQRILRGVSAVPKKTTRIKTELIDVDLVRGSTFPKAKPQHSWIAATSAGFIRVLFLPFFFLWWKQQTSTWASSILVVLYFLQGAAMYLYFSSDEADFPDVPTSEIVTPVVMMLVLAAVHSQIVATFSNKTSIKKVTRTKRKRIKRKPRTKNTSGDYESKSSPETASDDRLDCIHMYQNSVHIEQQAETSAQDSAASNRCQSSNNTFSSSTSTNMCSSKGVSGSAANEESENKKKNSDEESGLDSLDLTQQVDDTSPDGTMPNKTISCEIHKKYICTVNNNSSVDSSTVNWCGQCKMRTGDPSELSLLKSTAPREENADAGNVSSGEEYFVAKHPTPTLESWNSHLDKVPHLALSNMTECKSILNRCQSRRFSDIGSRSMKILSEEELNELKEAARRFSEDGLLTGSAKHRVGNIRPSRTDKSRIGGFRTQNSCSPIGKIYSQEKRCGRRVPSSLHLKGRACYSSCESEIETTSPNTPTKPQTSDLEWPLITNTDCNSDSSDCTSQSSQEEADDTFQSEDPFAWEMQDAPTPLFTAGYTGSDKVSCTIWEHNECKKVDLTVLDISSAVIRKVDSTAQSTEYFAVGLIFAVFISFLPLLYRLQNGEAKDAIQDVTSDVLLLNVPSTDEVARVTEVLQEIMLGSTWRSKVSVLIVVLQRFMLSAAFFFLLAVAERSFKLRFLYAKHFCHLTSSRRARRSDLPHFRLNKVRNIKTWLSVRSYLKKHGPQRSVDVIVSTTFIIEVCLLSFLCVQLLKDTEIFADRLYCWEIVCWNLVLGIFLMRFMTLGSKVNKKYRNLSVLITEQINLYLHMELKPHKKEELLLANSVLKLAADLLKELESPFKISGLCANPYLYNITKVVVLSAFSAVLTELLGFKLKLHKIKIK